MALGNNGIHIPFYQRSIDSEIIQTIDGRDLYRELGFRDFHNYSRWMPAQLKDAHLIEKRDFWFFLNHEENSGRGRPSTEYFLAVDAAKHVAMSSHTDIGYLIREYFIAAEKEWRLIERERILQEKFLLPSYDRNAPTLYPPELFIELCRVWGFPEPQGSRHSPGCRGIVHRDINGILPYPVQDVLFDEVENPYQADGKTRQERHWRKIVEPQRKEVLTPRIETILETCYRCPENSREKYKKDLMTHDMRRGIVIRLSPKVQMQLATHPEGQLWLFEAVAP
jgi:phage anti-repressor protein